MIVSFTPKNGGHFRPIEMNLTVRQVVGRLNKVYKKRERWESPGIGKPYYEVSELDLHGIIPPLGYFNAIRLPDGRIWDVNNGWRNNAGDIG